MAEEEQQPVEKATPIFRIRPHNREDRVTEDGSTWRVHTFLVVNETGEVVTDETDEGPKPIMLQSVPMRISTAVQIVRPAPRLLH